MTEISKGVIALLLICVAVLLIITTCTNRRVGQLEWAINNLQNQQMNNMHATQMMQPNTWEITNRIDSLRDELLQAASLSFDQQVRIEGYDSETASADVVVSFYLREHRPGDVVSISASGQGGAAWSASASVSPSGRFSAPMTLPLNDNYTFTFTSTGDTVVTGELTQLDLADMLCGRFWFALNDGSGSRPHNQAPIVTLWPEFRNNTEGNQSLRIRSLRLYLESDNETVMSWDLLWIWDEIGGHGEDWLQITTDAISFRVGNEPGQVSPDAPLITRLVIVDELGIRYEQIDPVYSHHWLLHDQSGSASVAAPVPAFPVHGNWDTMGRVRIVE